MNLQVSELMKLIIIIVLARYFSEVRTDRLTLADLVKVAHLDLGAGRIDPEAAGSWERRWCWFPVAVVGAFLAGIEWKHAAVGLGPDRVDDSDRLEHAAPFEAVPTAAH